MSIEGGPRKEKKAESVVQLYMTRDGTQWYRGPDGKAVVLDDAGDAERDRQHQNPDSEPSPGYPKFSERPEHAEIPSQGEPPQSPEASPRRYRFPRDGSEKLTTIFTLLSKAPDDAVEVIIEDGERESRVYVSKADADLLEQMKNGGVAPDKISIYLIPEQGKPKIDTPNGPLDLNNLGDTAKKRIDKKGVVGDEVYGPTSDDIPVEALDRHPILKGYYTDKYGRLISPEAMKERDARLEDRRRKGEINKGNEFVPPTAQPIEKKIDGDTVWNLNEPRFYGITPRPIREILRSEEGQVGFAEVLRRLDGSHADEIMAKSAEGKTLTMYEEKLLAYASLEFSRCAQQVEFIRVSMSKDDLEIVSRFDSRFKSLMAFNGSLRTMEIFRREIARTGMRNPGLLDQLQKAYEKLGSVRESHEYKAWQASVLQQSAETGVPLQHFGEVFGGLNPAKQAEVQRELERKSYAAKGAFGRIFDFGSSKRDAERAVQSAIYNAKRSGRSGSGALREYGDAMRDLSEVMKRTLGQEPISNALQQEAFRNEEVLPRADSGPATFKDAEKTQAQMQKDYTAELQRLMQQKKNGRDFDHLTRPQREEMLAPLREHFQSEFAHPRRGWFARAFQKIFENLFNDKYAAAINRPVLA